MMELKDAKTFYIIPFHIDNGDVCDVNGSIVPNPSIWKPAEMSVQDGVFYPYIQRFMQASFIHGVTLQPHDYRTYSLDLAGDACFNTIFKREMFIRSKERNFSFKFLNLGEGKNFLSTKLIICPKASVGLIIMAVQLTSSKIMIEDLIDFNYCLSKTKITPAAIYLKSQEQLNLYEVRLDELNSKQKKLLNDQDKASNQKEIDGINQKIEYFQNDFNNLEVLHSIVLDELERKRVQKEMNKKLDEEKRAKKNKTKKKPITSSGLETVEPADLTSEQSNEKVDVIRQSDYYWRLEDLITILLKGVNLRATRFNTNRCHLFTFYVQDVPEVNSEVMSDFQRIVHLVNKKYQVIETDNSSYCQTFKNVYLGSSVEGGAIMFINTKSNPKFFEEFSSSNLHTRYLWIYIMLVIQRYTLLLMLDKLTNVDNYEDSQQPKVSIKKLRIFLTVLTEIKVNTYFTNVSDISPINRFYQFCSERLAIHRMYDEIDSKMATLNAHLNQRTDQKKENIQMLFAYFLAVMAVASASNDGLDLLGKIFGVIDSSPGKQIVGVILLVAMSLFVLYLFIKEKRIK